MVRRTSSLTTLGCLVALACACSGADAPEQPTGQTEQALWSYPFQGELVYGEEHKADLTGGDFGHVYAFEGSAGQSVTFVLEWREPESSGLGVDIWVDDDSYTTLAEYYSWDESKAHVDVTFPQDGTYYLTVAHNFWGWFGRYPYKVAVDPHMCAQVTFDADTPDYDGAKVYAANNHEPGEGDPWTWAPDFGNGDFTVTEIARDVKMGACNGHIDDTCSTYDPQVCGGTIVGGGLFDDACAFRTVINAEAGTQSTGVGLYTEELSYCVGGEN